MFSCLVPCLQVKLLELRSASASETPSIGLSPHRLIERIRSVMVNANRGSKSGGKVGIQLCAEEIATSSGVSLVK